MARYDNVVRVIRFLERLEESRVGITLRAAADELKVSERTARRYIKALRDNGYHVDGGDGRYRLLRRPGTIDRLSEAERRQMVMAAIAAWPLKGTPFSPDPVLLNEQLFATPKQRELFARLKLPLSAPSRLAIDYRPHEGTLQNLLKALDEKKVVETEYFTASRNEWTHRRIRPHTFYYDSSLETLYLFAYCEWRKEVRTFAAHRFRAARITRNNFEVESTFSVEKHLANAFRVYRGKQTAEIVLAFAPSIAARVGERTWHASQRKRVTADGRLELTFTLDGDEEIRAFILSHGADARVLEPSWLAERIAREAAAIAAHYPRQRIGPKRAGAV